jgi:uncharacterized protein (TIGR03118 family)
MKLWNSSWGKKAPGCSRGARSLGTRLALESLENRYLLSAGFLQTNLISDLAGIARFTDSHLSNAWGIDYLPGGPFWIADNNPGLAGVVDGGGQPVALTYLGGNTATIPASVSGTPGSPTGVVANISSDFSAAGTTTGPSEFIFATEDGLLVSWNPGDGTQGVVAVNHSATADYTGLALGANSSGNFLYVANIKAGTIDVFDKNFAATTLSGNFTDPMLPAGYRPFNIQNIGGRLLVAYVLYDPLTNRGVPGAGNGVIDEFDTSGKFLARLVSNGTGSPLNAPWAFALAPANFGPFSNALLVGNFGDGHISAFNSANGTFLGQLSDPSGKPIAIDKLWGLKFGNGGSAGDPATLYFAAGIQNETMAFSAGCEIAWMTLPVASFPPVNGGSENPTAPLSRPHCGQCGIPMLLGWMSKPEISMVTGKWISPAASWKRANGGSPPPMARRLRPPCGPLGTLTSTGWT